MSALTVTEATVGLLASIGVIALTYAAVLALWTYIAGYFNANHALPVAPLYSGVAGTSKDLRVAWQLAIMEDVKRDMEKRGMAKLTEMALPGQAADGEVRQYSNSVSTDVRATMAVQRAMESSRLIIPGVREN